MHPFTIFTQLSQLGHWQIDLLTLGLLLASTIFTIIPEELLFVALGFVAHFGRIHPVEAILAAQFGLIPADFLTVLAGKKLGNKLLSKKPFSLFFSKHGINNSLQKLRESGGKLLFFTRFTPMLRTPIYLAAGISGFSLGQALLIDISAACIQVPIFFLLGFIFGKTAEHYVTVFSYITFGIAILIFTKWLWKPFFKGKSSDETAPICLQSPPDLNENLPEFGN